jgi:hypothetical protein
VKKVAKPPRTSRPTVEPRAEISKKRSKAFRGVRGDESTLVSEGAVDMRGLPCTGVDGGIVPDV